MKKNLNTGRRKEIVNSPESFQSICLVLSLRGLVLAARPQEVAPPLGSSAGNVILLISSENGRSDTAFLLKSPLRLRSKPR